MKSEIKKNNLDSLIVPQELLSEEYEYIWDKRTLLLLKAIPGITCLTKRCMNIVNEFVKTDLLGYSFKVSDKQFPEIYALLLKASKIISINPPPLFIQESPEIQAYTFGSDESNACVVLTRKLIEVAEPEELLFIIGHELGHIKSKHILYITLVQYLEGIFSSVNESFSLALKPAEIAINAWGRRAEITADRSGLISCQSLKTAQKAMFLLTCGSKILAKNIDLDEYLAQAKEVSSSYGKWQELFNTHPYTPKRIRSLEYFYDSYFYANRIEKNTNKEFYPNEDMDEAIEKILRDNPNTSLKKIKPVNDFNILLVMVAFAGAWEDGIITENEKTTLNSLILTLGFSEEQTKELNLYFDKPIDEVTIKRLLKYFNKEKIGTLPYVFSLLLIDQNGVKKEQIKFLEELVMAYGLDAKTSEKLVYDIGFRKEFFRNKCGVEFCSKCCSIFDVKNELCLTCGTPKNTIVIDEEKTAFKLKDQIFNKSSKLFTQLAKKMNEVATNVETKVKTVKKSAESINKEQALKWSKDKLDSFANEIDKAVATTIDPKEREKLLNKLKKSTNPIAAFVNAYVSTDAVLNLEHVLQGFVKDLPITIYDKSADAIYNSSHVGGGLHRLFDESHTIAGMWDKVQGANPNDSIFEELSGFFSAYYKDVMTPAGMPLFTINPDSYNKLADMLKSVGVSKDWTADALAFNVPEILGSTLGILSLVYNWKKKDLEKFSEMVGHFGVSSIASANPLLMIVIIVSLAYNFNLAKNENDYSTLVDSLAHGGVISGLFIATSFIIGGPVIIGILSGLIVIILLDSKVKKVSLSKTAKYIGETIKGELKLRGVEV